MADAILYYRTLTTLSDTAGATTPILLATNYPSQALSFVFSDNILEGISFDYENNIIDTPVPIGDGTRKINKTENGIRRIDLVINGVFKNPKTALSTDIGKLKTMSSISQIDAKHIYGKIGFYSPNAPDFSLDPNATSGATATKGYTITGFHLGYIGQKNTRYDFQIKLSYGGIFS